ncbi:hypothetical protein SAMN05428988_0363 [Chitinophaga sp. YR573]|uniref:hypothetical protein n=1 Tax=Chitinophaga sp. YR573 TaxID=1881040 RepID=UPI0008C3FB0E|nr:hypothetical protein [Chitinophaga sp. YR573]SEV91064.1 hypothetical protein SAMN05428988_0363 [Chitinophaga sp. YR573]
MNQNIQHKIDQYKKVAQRSQGSNPKPMQSKSVRVDGLAQVIRSQKDAENFMAELKSIVKRAQ